MAKPKKNKLLEYMHHHTVRLVLFALFVGLLLGFYSSFFFFNEQIPGYYYEENQVSNRPDAQLLSDHEHPLGTPENHTHDEFGNSIVDTMPMMNHEHTHDVISVPQDVIAPSVNFTIYPDTKSGYNIFIETNNFEFAPELVNTDNVWGKGHAHLYVDGIKINRVYGHWYHLEGLKSGSRNITVTLNMNDHSEMSYEGKTISYSKTIVVA